MTIILTGFAYVCFFLFGIRVPPGIWGAAEEKKKTETLPRTVTSALAGHIFLVKADDPSLSSARLLTRFENVSLQKTYQAIGIDLHRWKVWENCKKSGGTDALSEKYPMLSKFAWWFVESVRFSPAEVRQLHQELLEIQNFSADAEVVTFTKTMLSATQEAIDAGQPLGVYP